MLYERILAAAAAVPWAIEPTKGRVIADFLTRKSRGESIPAAEVETAKAARKDNTASRPARNVAVVPIYGTIMQRADLMMDYSGGTSTDEVGATLDQLASDPRVDVILLDVDSPGGSVFGVDELAAKIRAVRQQKKVVGIANSMAASAGYYLLSQASDVVVTPGGVVGSIGVYQMHVDQSKALEMSGQTVTLISAGEMKTAGNRYEPLSDAARASLQGMVNSYYESFVKAVAAGRGVPPSTVREKFGKGDIVLAKDALAAGMVDRVATFDETLARFGVTRSGASVAASADRSAIEIRRRRLRMGQQAT